MFAAELLYRLLKVVLVSLVLILLGITLAHYTPIDSWRFPWLASRDHLATVYTIAFIIMYVDLPEKR